MNRIACLTATALLAALCAATTATGSAVAQAGSTGGTLGNTHKSISGKRQEEPSQHKSREPKTRAAPRPAATPQHINLGGAWKAPFGAAQIHQQGNNLVFRNEFGWVSHGRWLDSNTVIADEWKVEGKVSSNGNLISWSNATQWSR